MLEKIVDFMLGNKSPLLQAGETRITMGSTYSPADFSALMKVVSNMVSSKELCEKFPLNDTVKSMLKKKDILGKLVDQGANSKDFGDQLASMCRDDI